MPIFSSDEDAIVPISSIIAKPGATSITAKTFTQYNPDTFESLKNPNFIECSAKQVLDEIDPITFDLFPNRRFIDVDTETFYTGIPNNRMPAQVVRRWIKVGNKYIPNDFPFCISLCDGKKSFVVYDTLENGFREFKKLIPLLADTTIDKVGHNIDYDLHMLANAGVDMRGRMWDTMPEAKLVRAYAFSNRLIDLATEMPNGITQYEHMLDAYKAMHRITDYRQIPRDLMTQYTSADVWNSLWALPYYYPRIIENNQEELLDVENQIMRIAFSMERTGIVTDQRYITEDLIPELKEQVATAEQKIYDEAGTMFNINSGQQLEKVLVDMGYGKSIKYDGKTGNPKFDKFQKERMLKEGVTLFETINTFMGSEKLLNTFAIKLSEMKDANNVVHCNFNPIEAKTGRFSISNPSMQNMPRRKDDRVRGGFIAPYGYHMWDFDFKSQESIILAHYCQSPYLIDNINAGKDIHTLFAAIINHCDYVKVIKQWRNDAKSVEFAIVYGAGADKVSAMTGQDVPACKTIIATVYHDIPEIDTFIKTANKIAKERGFMKTVMNRYVYLEKGREYACVNYIIQGSAAVSTKTRMIDLYKFLKANNYKSRMVLQVHDSLDGYVKDTEEAELIPYWKWIQTERKLFRIPVVAESEKCIGSWRTKEECNWPAVEPPKEMLDKMEAYNIWEESILGLELPWNEIEEEENEITHS